MIDPKGYVGQQIGEYRLLHYLGRGTFGAVYLSEHVHNHSQVAVKVLHFQLTGPNDLRDFLNEARTIRLRHPCIVPILDFGLSRDNFPFLAMAFAEGGTLRSRHAKGEKIPVLTVDTYVQQIASALQYAHDLHIIHRDVKPENMLMRATGVVQLSDFGIAKMIEQESQTSQLTGRGTPAYTAPEQNQGRPCPASDQYSLAVVVYEWLTGARPFQGTPLEVSFQHLSRAPRPLHLVNPGISAQIEQVVLQALAKAPEERFAQITDFAWALHQAIQGSATAGMTVQRSNIAPAIGPSPASAQHLPLSPASLDEESSLHETQFLRPSSPAIIPLALPLQTNIAPRTPDKTPASGKFSGPARSSSSFRETGLSRSEETGVPASHRSRWYYRKRVLVACFCLLLLIGGSGGILLFAQQQARQEALFATATTLTGRKTATVAAAARGTATQQARQEALSATATALTNAYEAITNYTTNNVIGLTTANVTGQNEVYLAWLNSKTDADGRNHINIASSVTGQSADFNNRVDLTDSSAIGPGICTFNGRLYVIFQGGEPQHPIHIGYFNGSNLLASGGVIKSSNGTLQTTWSRPVCASYNGQLYVAWAGNDTQHSLHLISSSDGMNFGPVTKFPDPVGCASPSPSCGSINSVPTAPFISVMNFPGFNSRLYVSWHPATSDAIDIGYYDAANPSNILHGFKELQDTAQADPVLQSYNDQLWLGWGATGSAILQVSSSADGQTFSNPGNPCGYRGAFAAGFASFNGHLYIADDVQGNGIGYCQVQ